MFTLVSGIEDIEDPLVKTFRGHEDWVWDVQFSADDSFLVSVSSDKTARLWHIKDLIDAHKNEDDKQGKDDYQDEDKRPISSLELDALCSIANEKVVRPRETLFSFLERLVFGRC